MGNNYSIRQTSDMLCIPKDSLRYYDKLGLVSPKRGENNYRYYDDQDLLDLRYIEVMKFCSFSLSEISELLQLKRKPDETNHPMLIRVLAEKEYILDKKIAIYQYTKKYFEQMREVMLQKKSMEDAVKVDRLVSEIYTALCENEEI
jgi:DNA-binding transcriptional MerR regulator